MKKFPATRLARLIEARAKHGKEISARVLLHGGSWALVWTRELPQVKPAPDTPPEGETNDEEFWGEEACRATVTDADGTLYCLLLRDHAGAHKNELVEWDDDDCDPPEGETEEAEARYIDKWPKTIFLCTRCDEETDSDPCQECAKPDEEYHPQVLHVEVVPASERDLLREQRDEARGELADCDKTAHRYIRLFEENEVELSEARASEARLREALERCSSILNPNEDRPDPWVLILDARKAISAALNPASGAE